MTKTAEITFEVRRRPYNPQRPWVVFQRHTARDNRDFRVVGTYDSKAAAEAAAVAKANDK
jgi:hypothetical protein